MTKLTDKKIRYICRHRVNIGDWTTERLARQYNVSHRRIQQLVKEYKQTGKFPCLNPKRRPKGKPLTKFDKEIIDKAWEDTRFGARLLYHEIKRRGYHIAHHKINKYLLQTGRTIPNPNKQKKRKRCRYERTHSFSLIHGDWHRTTEDHPHAIVWLDDASRYVLIGGEYPNANMENSIKTMQDAIEKAKEYNTFIKDVNTDRGTEFYSNHPNSTSEFQEYLKEKGIKHVPSRRNNPQTNGKLERFWYEYDKHRWRFDNINLFLDWYNQRLHGSLWLKIGETPKDAVIRKLEPGVLLNMFMSLIE
jgi:putative transposase